MSTLSDSDSSDISLDVELDSIDSGLDNEKNEEFLLDNSDNKYNYYLLEYDKPLNKFSVFPFKFVDRLKTINKSPRNTKKCSPDNTDSNLKDIENTSLYELVYSHRKTDHILLPIYKGKLVKKKMKLSDFKSPVIILILNINLLFNTKKRNVPYNLLNMDVNNIINSILSHNRTSQPENAESENEEVDENVINSQNDIANIASQLMNIYSNSMSNMSNLARQNEEKYKDEIELIRSMGFDNKEKIIQSLIVCNGNVEQAINYYLTIN